MYTGVRVVGVVIVRRGCVRIARRLIGMATHMSGHGSVYRKGGSGCAPAGIGQGAMCRHGTVKLFCRIIVWDHLTAVGKSMNIFA